MGTGKNMKLRIGYEMVYSCPQPTPMMGLLNVHASRVSDLITPDHVMTDPATPTHGYRDSFGNWVTRLILPQGDTKVYTEALINDSGEWDAIAPDAKQNTVETHLILFSNLENILEQPLQQLVYHTLYFVLAKS